MGTINLLCVLTVILCIIGVDYVAKAEKIGEFRGFLLSSIFAIFEMLEMSHWLSVNTMVPLTWPRWWWILTNNITLFYMFKTNFLYFENSM